MAKPTGKASPKTVEDDAPLLSIQSLERRRGHVDIDGKKFALINLDAIGIRARQKIADLLTATFELGARASSSSFTDADDAKYSKTLRQLAPLILPDITSAQLRQLGDGHLSDIAVAFFVWSGESVPEKMAITKRMQALAESLPTPIGATSSRGSKGTTNRRTRRHG